MEKVWHMFVVYMCILGVLGIVPLVCLVSKKTRVWAAGAVISTAGTIFFLTWLSCAIYTFHVSIVLGIFGLFCGLFGIVPLSMVIRITKDDWPGVVGTILALLVGVAVGLAGAGIRAIDEKESSGPDAADEGGADASVATGKKVAYDPPTSN